MSVNLRKPKICLILDNPLRDLDGLVLLAWQLAQRGAEAWLVPMYDQAFDIRAIGADFVLLNYIRQNNLDHALSYMRGGIKVGVLDTEGMAGKSVQQFAQLISDTGGASLMDLYCVWGQGQFDALTELGIIPQGRLKLTGCPRYDYCATPWRASLPLPDCEPGYVLINTNFPGTNSRFARSSEEELQAFINGGFSHEYATSYMRDERQMCQNMIQLIRRMTERFPQQRFVLRPHPFESPTPYEEAIKADNFVVRQQGTSITWINHARVLIQLNCLTAIEAAAFGTPTLSPTWLNTPSLTVPLSVKLSTNIDSEEALFARLTQELVKPAGTISVENKRAIEEYLQCDGHASERAVAMIYETLANGVTKRSLPKSSLRFHALNVARALLGHATYRGLQARFQSTGTKARKKPKQFGIEQVISLVQRIEHATASAHNVEVTAMATRKLKHPRLASGQAICFSARPTQP